MRSFFVLVLLGLWAYTAEARSDGAPTSACFDLTPQHGFTPAESNKPIVEAQAGTYVPGGTVGVKFPLQAYRGILLQARTTADDAIVGTWSGPSDKTKTIRCTADGDSLTHIDNSQKLNLEYIWTAPESQTGDIYFTATIALDKTKYWVGLRSATLTQANPSEDTTTPESPTTEGQAGGPTKGQSAGETTKTTKTTKTTTAATITTLGAKVDSGQDRPSIGKTFLAAVVFLVFTLYHV